MSFTRVPPLSVITEWMFPAAPPPPPSLVLIRNNSPVLRPEVNFPRIAVLPMPHVLFAALITMPLLTVKRSLLLTKAIVPVLKELMAWPPEATVPLALTFPVPVAAAKVVNAGKPAVPKAPKPKPST